MSIQIKFLARTKEIGEQYLTSRRNREEVYTD